MTTQPRLVIVTVDEPQPPMDDTAGTIEAFGRKDSIKGCAGAKGRMPYGTATWLRYALWQPRLRRIHRWFPSSVPTCFAQANSPVAFRSFPHRAVSPSSL